MRTEPDIEINGQNISPCNADEFVKYLGQRFSPQGVERCEVGDLFEPIQRIRKAPLKPFQKFCIIKQFLIPKYISKKKFNT